MQKPRFEELDALEQLRGQRVVLYFGGGKGPPLVKALNDEDVPLLYECLRALGPVEQLGLFFHTHGGFSHPARRLALLLREHTRHLHVLVPFKARSAGTLLCLAADELILGPMAELSPLDPYIGGAGESQPGMPSTISSEDVRAFWRMAKEWFGLEREEHRMQALNLLCQRIFPTSLSSIFRAELQVRQIAESLLRYPFPEDAVTRGRIVNTLVAGYHAHDYGITRSEVLELGLRARAAAPREEALMWSLYQSCQKYLNEAGRLGEGGADGLLIGADFTARHVVRWIEVPVEVTNAGVRNLSASRTLESRWEVL